MDLLGEYDEEEESDGVSPSSASVQGAVEEPVSSGVEGEPDGKSSPPFWHGSVGAALPPGQVERLRRVGSQGSGAGTPSDMSSPASQNGELVFEVAQPGTAAKGRADNTPGSADLPAAPPGPVEEAVKANVAKLYAQLKTGSNINSDLRDKKEFQNPGILERLVSEFKIKQSGTNYNDEIFSPNYPTELYFDALNQQAARRDALNRATRTSIGFDAGGVQKPDYPARPIIQHAASSAGATGANHQSAVAVAAAATALAAAHGVAAGTGSSATHPPAAAAADGPVKKKSKWDSAISSKNAAAAPLAVGAPPLRPPLPPNASGGVTLPGGLQPSSVLLQQQLLQQQLLMRQQQQLASNKR